MTISTRLRRMELTQNGFPDEDENQVLVLAAAMEIDSLLTSSANSFDVAQSACQKLKAAKSAIKGLMELLAEVDDIAYNEKMNVYDLSYWLKKQIKPIIAAEDVLEN